MKGSTPGTDYARGVTLKAYKENATDGNLDFAFTIVTRKDGVGLTEAARFTSNKILAIGTSSPPSTGTIGLIFGDGTALASLAANTAGLYADDIGGTVMVHVIDEAGNGGPIPALVSKSTTGDPTGFEGLFEINTFDNTFKVYADGAWRTLASGW